MKARYLLPCSCGREIPVETAQAGQTIRCSCGAEQEVPTLMRMSSLRRAEQPVATPPQHRWGLSQRLLLVGALVALPALAFAGFLLRSLPTAEQVVPTQAPLDELTVGQTWQIWQDLRSGIERRPFPAETFYERLAQTNRQWMMVALSVFGVGLLIMFSALFVPKPKRRRPPSDSVG